MPDISMCNGFVEADGSKTHMCNQCYRHNATPSEYRQSYFTTPPMIHLHDSRCCEYFWMDVSTEKINENIRL